MEYKNTALYTVKECGTLEESKELMSQDGKEVRITIDNSDGCISLPTYSQKKVHLTEVDPEKDSSTSSSYDSSSTTSFIGEVVEFKDETYSDVADEVEDEDDSYLSTPNDESEGSFYSDEEWSKAENESANDYRRAEKNEHSKVSEEDKENIASPYIDQTSLLDPFSLLDDYNRIEPKDRPTPIDLEAGVYWFVVPNPDDCGVIWRLWPHKPKFGRLRLLNRALELTEGPFNKDGENKKPQEEPKVKKLVDLYRAFSIHIRVKHPFMGEGTCLALVFIGETVLLKPETKNDSDVNYWHRLMMSIKVKDFPEIYGRPVTRHDFMDVAWAVSIVGKPAIWDSPDPFTGSADIYKAHRFFQGPKWFAIYDNTLYLCDQDVIPQRCNPPYRPDNSVEIPWSVVYQIGVERCYFYMRMTANGPWGLGTIYLMLESWDAAKAVSAHFRHVGSSKNPFQKIRVRDAEETEEVPQDESKSWFFSLSGWKSRQRRERLREEGRLMPPLPENKRIDLFDRLIPKTQKDLEIEMEQMSAPPIREQILRAIALWHTHPPPPYPRTLEEAMEPKSFFPGPPEERDVPEVSDGENKSETPSTSKASRKRRNTEKIKFFRGVDYVHMKNDGTILTDEQPCLHESGDSGIKTKTKSELDSQSAREKIAEALITTNFKIPPGEEHRENFHKTRKRAATSHTFFDRRLSGIFRRAHSLKSKWLRPPRKSKLENMTDAELFKWPMLERRTRQDSFGDTDTDLFPKTVYGQSYLKEIHEKKRTYPEQEEDVQWDFSGNKPKPYRKFTYECAAALQLGANAKAVLNREALLMRSELNKEPGEVEETGIKSEEQTGAKELSSVGNFKTENEDDYIKCDHGISGEKAQNEKPKSKNHKRKSRGQIETVNVPHDSMRALKTMEEIEKIHDKTERRAALKEWRAKELRTLLPSNITDEQIHDIVQAEFFAEDAATYAKELTRKATSSLACAKKADQEAKNVREIADRCDIEACKAQADASDAKAKAAGAAAKLTELLAAYGVPNSLTKSERSIHKSKRNGHRHRHQVRTGADL